jgi:hypothetical protein
MLGTKEDPPSIGDMEGTGLRGVTSPFSIIPGTAGRAITGLRSDKRAACYQILPLIPKTKRRT